MKRVFSRSFFVAGLLVAGLGVSAVAQPAAAPVSATAPTGTTKVAVINFQAAVFQTNEGKRNVSELQKKFDPKRTQLKAQADEIDTLKKQLQAAGDKLSDTERQSRTAAIDTKEKALQRDGEDASGEYEQAMQQTYQQLAEKVYAIVQSYATQHGIGVVLDASVGGGQQQQLPTVLWANQSSTDITKAVIDAYNVKSGVPAPPPEVPSAPTSHAPATHAPAHPSGTAH
ncbi:MAG TPA: OmpH family outer membrane protein [Silvibacterium sp.]|nr:OmpH family outer membrane protein [Silvibacterium sp.]